MKKVARKAKKPKLPSNLKLNWYFDGSGEYATRGVYRVYVRLKDDGWEIALHPMVLGLEGVRVTVDGTLKEAKLEAERLLRKHA